MQVKQMSQNMSNQQSQRQDWKVKNNEFATPAALYHMMKRSRSTLKLDNFEKTEHRRGCSPH